MWRRENSWPYRDSNSDLSVVQPVYSRYTDYIQIVKPSGYIKGGEFLDHLSGYKFLKKDPTPYN
jgi:hypothetical protein